MSAFRIEDASCEDKYVAMAAWWQRHCKSFSEWFLGLSADKQKEVLLKACPDMPLTSTQTRRNESGPETFERNVQTTDIILPELALEPLLKCNGRIFIIFMTRRCVSETYCQLDDTVFLTDLFTKGYLPSFSQGALDKLDTPFVDPNDPEENVQCLTAGAGEAFRAKVHLAIKEGMLIHADVWLALKIRRTAIIHMLEVLVNQHQSEVAVKPSPTYDALLIAELQMHAATTQHAAEVAAAEEGEDSSCRVEEIDVSSEAANSHLFTP